MIDGNGLNCIEIVLDGLQNHINGIEIAKIRICLELNWNCIDSQMPALANPETQEVRGGGAKGLHM